MTALAQFLKKIYHALPEPPSSYFAYKSSTVNPYELLPPNATIFDIGSKDARGDYSFGLPPDDARVVDQFVERPQPSTRVRSVSMIISVGLVRWLGDSGT